MPYLVISSCKDHNNNDIEGAVVVAISQDDLLNNIIHTDEGSDFPSNMAFLRCNRTDANGQCVIYVAGGSKATVSFVTEDQEIGTEAQCHISFVS